MLSAKRIKGWLDDEAVETLQLTRRQVLEVAAALSAGVALSSLDVFRPKAAKAAATATLTFFGQTGGSNTGREIAHRQIFKNFTKLHPDVQVNGQFFPWEQLQQKLGVAVASSSPPDVLYFDGPTVPQYAHAGVIQPIDHVYSASELADTLPQTIVEGTYNGHYYGPAESQSSEALFYNTKMLDKLGVKLPVHLKDAWTWPAILPLLRHLTVVSGGRIQVFGFERVHPPDLYNDGMFIRSMGRSRNDPTFVDISPDGLNVHGYMDTAEAIAGFQFFQDLFVKYKVAPTVPGQEMFATGKAAMAVATEANVTDIEMNYPNLEYGITPIPYFHTPITHDGSLHYTVATKTRNADMAAQLAKFMGNAESSLIMFKYLGQVPALKSVFPKITAYNTYPRKIFLDELVKWGVNRPKSVGYVELDAGVSTAMNDMIAGAPVVARVHSMVTAVNQQLAKYR